MTVRDLIEALRHRNPYHRAILEVDGQVADISNVGGEYWVPVVEDSQRRAKERAQMERVRQMGW